MPPPLPRHVTKESLRRIARALPPQEHKVEMLDTLFGFVIHSITGDFTFLLPQKTIQISTLKPALESSCISFVVAPGSRRKDECFSAILIYVKADSHLIV